MKEDEIWNRTQEYELAARQEALDDWERRVPPVHRAARLGSLEPEAQEAIRAWLDPSDPVTMLMLVGQYGAGKSFTGWAALRELARRRRNWDVWSMVDLMDELRSGGEPGTYRRVCTVNGLLIDDVGAEKPSEWTVEKTAGIIDARWRDQRLTVLTSNWPIKHLEDDGVLSGRSASRLKDVTRSRQVLVGLGVGDRRAHPTTAEPLPDEPLGYSVQRDFSGDPEVLAILAEAQRQRQNGMDVDAALDAAFSCVDPQHWPSYDDRMARTYWVRQQLYRGASS